MALQVACPPGVLALPNTLSCSSYYECLEGNIAIEKKCPEGLLYNAAIGKCDLPEYVTCSSGVGLSTMITMLLAYASTLNNGHQQGSIDTSKICVPGQYYYTPHAECDKYYLCADGLAYVNACPNGLKYNADTEMCDFDSAPGTCSTNRCEGGYITVTEDAQVITSHPGYGQSNYDNNADCTWYLRPCDTCGSMVYVDFEDFDVEVSINNDCSYDNFTVALAGNTDPKMQMVMCAVRTGQKRSFDLSGYDRQQYPLQMNFRSNAKTTARGFSLKVSTQQWLKEVSIPPTYGSGDGCNHNLTVSSEANRIYSHWGFNGTNYHSDMNCTWYLTPCTTCLNIVVTEIEYFDVYNYCQADWLSLGDPANPDTKRLCGLIPKGNTFVMTAEGESPQFQLNWFTDRSGTKTGFAVKVYSIAAKLPLPA